MKNSRSFKTIFAVAATATMLLFSAQVASAQGPKGDKEPPRKEHAAPAPAPAPDKAPAFECPYCHKMINCPRAKDCPWAKDCPRAGKDFKGPRHGDFDGPRRGEGRPGDCPMDHKGPRMPRDPELKADYQAAFGQMDKFNSMSDKEKKQVLAKQKDYFDKLDAKHEAAKKQREKDRKEFQKQWKKFDKLSIEEQQQLISKRIR